MPTFCHDERSLRTDRQNPLGGRRPEIIDSIRYALETNGYEVIVARDGNQGLALAEREKPDLMILDMMMPKRSGFLVLEKLRRSSDLLLPSS